MILLEAFGAALLACLLLIGAVSALVWLFERTLERHTYTSWGTALDAGAALAVALGACLTASLLAGEANLLTIAPALYLGLICWIALGLIRSSAAGNRGRGGIIRPAPWPRDRAPRRGRA